WEHTEPIMTQLGLTPAYAVCANGALTLRRLPDGSYERFQIETFDPGPALQQIRGHLADGRFMVELPDGSRLYTNGMTDWDLTRATEVEFEQLLGQPVTRIVVVSPEHSEEEFLQIVEAIGLHQVAYAIGWTAWLDIAPAGVNKGVALERVRAWLDIPASRVVAVGDGRNDVEMLEWAARSGRGVAMGQAPAEVHAVASESTVSVAEAGLAQVLATLL
ncbi:MAG: HAD hydrolase family protein, partial [Mycetocola sp.]